MSHPDYILVILPGPPSASFHFHKLYQLILHVQEPPKKQRRWPLHALHIRIGWKSIPCVRDGSLLFGPMYYVCVCYYSWCDRLVDNLPFVNSSTFAEIAAGRLIEWLTFAITSMISNCYAHEDSSNLTYCPALYNTRSIL